MTVQADQCGSVLSPPAPTIATSITSAVIMTLHRGDRLDLFDRALASLLAQRDMPGPLRIYLCCDGPLPATHEAWLVIHRAHFHRVLRSRQSEGLARALNRLIDVLEDEAFVFRMDGDDISLPTRCAEQIAYLRAHPDLGLVGCQAQDIDADGHIIAERRYPITPDACRTAVSAIMPVLHPTFCLRREILRDGALRYPDAHLSEDLAFLVVLMRRGVQVANLPRTLFQWRIGAGFFDRRRSLKRGLAELLWYNRAISLRHGWITSARLKPLARFGLRLLPRGVQRLIYRLPLRARLARVTTSR